MGCGGWVGRRLLLLLDLRRAGIGGLGRARRSLRASPSAFLPSWALNSSSVSLPSPFLSFFLKISSAFAGSFLPALNSSRLKEPSPLVSSFLNCSSGLWCFFSPAGGRGVFLFVGGAGKGDGERENREGGDQFFHETMELRWLCCLVGGETGAPAGTSHQRGRAERRLH